jgi:CheY-like chemotaxis protein
MLSRSRLVLILGLALAPGVAPSALAQVPGRDAFAREPKTPLETWEVVSYLIRVGQPDQAAPYIKKFLDLNPDDAAMLEVRDTYGVGSILALSDYPETRPFAKTLADRLAQASIRMATDPERMDRAIVGLSKSREEQAVAVDRLRQAGSYAIPPWLRALNVAGLDPSVRTPVAENLGRLDRNAVPALIAALDSPDGALVGDVCRALGQIGDPRAIPALTYLTARTKPDSPARSQAAVAILQITGRDFVSQARTPVRVLADEARKYHNHAYRFPGDPIVLWLWDDAAKVPAPVQVPVRDAEGILGLRAAKEALDLDPTDVEAKVTQLSLGLDRDPAAWRAAALEAGPSILSKVLRRAVAEKRNDLASTVAPILGLLANRNDLLITDRPNPLVDALISGDRRTQFASAEAIVKLDPRRPFPGSSRLVPVLSRFLTAQPTPRALVIDGNAERASQTTGYLRALGYDARTAPTGAQGFTEAADSADIELIAVDPNTMNDPWDLTEILGNLKADPRTSGIPVFLVGPLDIQNQFASKLESFPDVKFLVTPAETTLLKGQLDRAFASLGVRPLSAADRADFAKRSASLLAQIARSPGSPFEADLPTAEPSLSLALNGGTAAIEAAEALGDIPGTDSQRTLADVALDPSKPAPVRLATAGQLGRNIRRFGPRLAADQEKRLVEELGQEADPAFRNALAEVVGALKPGPDASASLITPSRPSTP